MRKLNRDSSRSIMPLFHSSKAVPNGQFRNGFVPEIEISGCPSHGKHEVKQKMLEHEAVFKNQVCELHRLYSVQRGIMDCGGRASEEPLCSSSVQGSKEAMKQHMASCAVEGLSVSTEPKKLFDLRRLPNDYVNGVEEEERKLSSCKFVPGVSEYAPPTNLTTDTQGLKRRSIGLYDLNEPLDTCEEDAVGSSIDLLSRASFNGDTNATLAMIDGIRKEPNTGRKAGLNQNNLCPIPQDYIYKTPYSAQSSSVERDQFHHGLRRDSTVNSTRSFLNDRRGHGLKSADRIHDLHNSNHSGHITSWPLGSQGHSVLPWVKPSSDSAPKMSPFENSSRERWPSMLRQEQIEVMKRQVNSSFLNGSFRADSIKPGMDVSSSKIKSKISSGKAAVLQDLNIDAINDAPEDQLPPLPWLNSYNNEMVIDLNQPSSSDAGIVRRNGIASNQTVTKILGAPISSRNFQEVKNGRKNRTIDLNQACEPDELTASEELIVERKKRSRGGDYVIDLNSCIDDFEDHPPTPHNASKVVLEIDLEIPASMESEDDVQSSKSNGEQRVVDAFLKNAATIMVDMCSLRPRNHVSDAKSSQDPLRWFANVVFSCENNDEGEHRNLPSEIDEFEAMTLQLEETKEEEDYNHNRHSIPQMETTEEAEVKLRGRPRARRGRQQQQRKNFQRDVLPGMKSLSRHEVNEDLQTFAGIMRASGQPWTCGSRGRRRAAPVITAVVRTHIISTKSTPKVSCGEFTGWGRTTQRPRRQRCAPTTGNHQMYLWT